MDVPLAAVHISPAVSAPKVAVVEEPIATQLVPLQ
jgi:hypothetical protein